MKLFVLVLALFFLTACQNKRSMESVAWQSGSGSAPPELPKEFKSPTISLNSKVESIQRYVQTIHGAEVENSYVQVIKNKSNEPLFIKMKYSNEKMNSLKAKISQMNLSSDNFFKDAKKNFSELRRATYVSPLKIIVSTTSGHPQLYYQFDVISKDAEAVYQWKMYRPNRVFDKKQVSSYFDGQGMAFPNGPELSQVEEVILPNLINDGSLRNQRVSILTDSGQPAVSPQNTFYFKPEDPRFDQVQVFYYANKMIQNFKNRLGIELPFNVEFKTHIGYPAKKTVMFYYNHRVHLGQGDEVSYKDILKDPSIVMHETAHAFVDAISGLPQGSLNEAFADFFTASFLDNPNLGETSYLKGPYTRTIDNSVTFSEKKEAVYADSLIISGMLWEIRKLIGADKSEKLALKTLARLGPDGLFENVAGIVRKIIATDLSEEEQQKILKVLELRQFPSESK